jgi:hypothetical protein
MKQIEVWKTIPKTQNKYFVSNLGRVKSVHGKEPKILSQFITGGYLGVNLTVKGVMYKYYVHRLVANAFCRKRYNKIQVDHVNSRRFDNRAVNLEWVTAEENIRRANEYGKIRRLRPGEGTNRILTESQVVKLKHDIRMGKYNLIETADYYGVSIETIIAIMKGKRWAHIL